MSNESFKESWWLMYSDFPNLNWARLRVFGTGMAKVFDSDEKTHSFSSEGDAVNWLLEDEFTSYEKLDEEDEREYEISISSIRPPVGTTLEELKGKMYVKAKKA
ncbi:hypothetical protein [Undibacterium fentianense]|uniref:Uncharacterized protein n=1 Tax=Undibacterium fentianense TaxID=2828728 RepID=A0A941E5L6_9BURK|nr:hypothetical protein [Undibacterium fentianense]MBR7801386.1 hypothetical protein [Undibacterium fentianense]